MNIDFAVNFIKYYGAAMVANAMPVLIKNGTPMDRGLIWIDNKRLLGNGKTWEGFAIGVMGSYLASMAISIFFNDHMLFFKLWLASIIGLLGDIIESFFKRRLGIKRGEPLPIFDQLDFAIAATIFYHLIGELNLFKDLWFIILSFTLIVALHLITNSIAYILRLKDKPW